MISQERQADLDLWEVWIEYDQFNPKNFGMLYVLGEILTDYKNSNPEIVKRGRLKSDQLVLQVPARPTGRCHITEVYYSEAIEDLNQYSSISIYAGTELVAVFDEIEVMI
ncbi:MAG: hypothetical protein ACJ75F_05145 [Flavisolibacter sp.]|jgi:hypothetical protein